MRTTLVILIPCLVVSVVYLAGTRLLYYSRPTEVLRERAAAPAPGPSMETGFLDCVHRPQPERQYWAFFGNGPGVAVYGFPSTGGFYLLRSCFGIELDFLGLDRFNATKRPSKTDPDWQAKEDAHCDRMRRLGATWWESSQAELEHRWNGNQDADPYNRVGWPTGGGVWVLHTTYGQASGRGAAILYNARTMDERCEIIKRLGGIFYEDPTDCPYLDLS